jgi:hypothetical protein
MDSLSLILGLALLGGISNAEAQAGAIGSALTDTAVITSTEGGAANLEIGFVAGSFGSSSLAKTNDGYTFTGFYDRIKTGKASGYQNTMLLVSGFSADPGAGWLNSAVAGSVTFFGSAATYSYANGQATWVWTTGPAFLDKPNPVQTTITHAAQIVDLNLRYEVLGVDYAPPGAKSTVNYGNSAMRGTSTSNMASFTNGTMIKASVSGGGSVGIVKGMVTESETESYEQEADSSSSVTVSTTASNADIVAGPQNSMLGVDHDFDVIWVWLNPLPTFAVGPGTVVWTGYAFNGEDNADEMEVVPLYVSWLKNPSTIPTNVATRLARGWDTSGVGGLTTSDYSAILAADPFASTTYNPNTDSTHRFDLQSGETFSYEPPPAGGQPITETFSVATTATSSAGQGASTTQTSTYSVDYSASASILATFSSMMTSTTSYKTVDKWSSTINSSTGRTAALSITGPAVADNYTGPTTIQVWRDNVYGSYMFYPVQ